MLGTLFTRIEFWTKNPEQKSQKNILGLDQFWFRLDQIWFGVDHFWSRVDHFWSKVDHFGSLPGFLVLNIGINSLALTLKLM